MSQKKLHGNYHYQSPKAQLTIRLKGTPEFISHNLALVGLTGSNVIADAYFCHTAKNQSFANIPEHFTANILKTFFFSCSHSTKITSSICHCEVFA